MAILRIYNARSSEWEIALVGVAINPVTSDAVLTEDIAVVGNDGARDVKDNEGRIGLSASGVTMPERGSKPSNPAGDSWRFYFKNDGLYHLKDDGTETGPLGTGDGGGAAGEFHSVLFAESEEFAINMF